MRHHEALRTIYTVQYAKVDMPRTIANVSVMWSFIFQSLTNRISSLQVLLCVDIIIANLTGLSLKVKYA